MNPALLLKLFVVTIWVIVIVLIVIELNKKPPKGSKGGAY